MTYDPSRDARAPSEMNPNVRPYNREKTGSGKVILLAAMVALIIGGLVYYGTSDTNTASNEMRAPVQATPPASIQRETTGTGSTPPAPQTPTR